MGTLENVENFAPLWKTLKHFRNSAELWKHLQPLKNFETLKNSVKRRELWELLHTLRIFENLWETLKNLYWTLQTLENFGKLILEGGTPCSEVWHNRSFSGAWERNYSFWRFGGRAGSSRRFEDFYGLACQFCTRSIYHPQLAARQRRMNPTLENLLGHLLCRLRDP